MEALWTDLGARYGVTGPCRFTPDRLIGADSRLVIAWIEGRPLGSGAIIPFAPDVAEVKRIYVAPEVRGRGVGRHILEELESLACAMGFWTLRLETGIGQPEAIRLYERAGFARFPCWGKFAADPLCLCYEKRLAKRYQEDTDELRK